MNAVRTQLKNPDARLTAMIGLVVLLFVIALGVAIWRYGVSRDSDNQALAESQSQVVAQQARTAITDEGGLVDAYGSDKDPADLHELAGVKTDLRTALEELRATTTDPAELAQLDAVEAGQRRLDKIFTDQVIPVAGTPNFDQGVKPYAAEVGRVTCVVASTAWAWLRGPRGRSRRG